MPPKKKSSVKRATKTKKQLTLFDELMGRLQKNEGTISFYIEKVLQLRHQMQNLEKHYGVDYQSLHHRMNALEDGLVAKQAATASREEERDAIRSRVRVALHEMFRDIHERKREQGTQLFQSRTNPRITLPRT